MDIRCRPRGYPGTARKVYYSRFHRPILSWVNNVIAVGFDLEAMQEPRPSATEAAACPEVADNRIEPLFLHIAPANPIDPLW